MANQKRSNRLNAPLMWSFRDAHRKRNAKSAVTMRTEEGEQIIASRKTAAEVAITEPMLRREVWLDLEALLNTIALESTAHEVEALEHVRASILNFGLPDMAHRSIDELARNDRSVERDIETALRNFEPRLIPETVRIQRDTTVETGALQIRFVIHADLACRPVDIPLEFTAEMELVSGKMVVNRL